MNINLNNIFKQRYSWPLTFLTIVFFVIALWGTFNQGWWKESGWVSTEYSLSYLIFIFSILILGGACLAYGVAFPLLLFLPVVFFIGMAGIGTVAAVLWFWICATIVGATLLAELKDKSSTIWSVRNSGAGFAVIGTLISLMSHFPINTPIVNFIVISGLAFFSAWRVGVFNTNVDIFLGSLFVRQKQTVFKICIQTLVLVCVTLMLFLTTLPEFGHDALAMHLNIPARILESKRWNYDVNQYIWSVMPFGASWLLLPPYFLAGEQAAKLMNTSFLFATAWLSYRILIPRIGYTSALIAPLLFLSLPMTMLLSVSVYAEPLVGFLFLLGFAELSGTVEKKHGSWLYMGVVIGYLTASKVLGLPLVPILLVAAAILSRKEKFPKASISIIFASILLFLLFSIHPYIVAFFKTGNPLFPFYNTIFKSPFFTTQSFFGNGPAFANPFYYHPLSINMLWESSIKSRLYGEFGANGAIGIVFLVLIPLAFLTSIIKRSWWVLAGMLAAITYCVLVFQTQAYLRYISQILPWFIVFGVWALAQASHPLGIRAVLVILICLVSLMRYPSTVGMFGHSPLTQMMDPISYRNMLEFYKPSVVVGDLIQKNVSLRNKKILIIGTDPVFSHFPSGTIAFSWHSWPFFSSPVRDTNFKKLLLESNVELIVHPVGENEFNSKEILSITSEVFIINGIRVGAVKNEAMYEVK